MRRHLTYGNVVASLALFIALSGGAYAAIKLPKNSVTTVQVKNGSLLAKDFKKGQLKAKTGLPGTPGDTGAPGSRGVTGPAGATGSAGAAGTTGEGGTSGTNGTNGTNGSNGQDGAPGSALGFASIGATGLVASAKNISQANVTHTLTGEYCFDNLPFTPKNVVVTKDILNGGASFVSFDVQAPGDGAGIGSCSGGANAVVDAFKAALQTVNGKTSVVGQLTDVGFYIVFN